MLIQELRENERHHVHIFYDTYIKSSQIHQLAIMYHIEDTSHDMLQHFLFQNLYKLFFHACNLDQ